MWVVILLVALGWGVWSERDNVAAIIPGFQISSQTQPVPTSTFIFARPTVSPAGDPTPTSTLPFSRPTVSPVEDPTPAPASASVSQYITKHGKTLPLIDAAVLENEIVALINLARSAGGLERLVRAPSLDYPATQHSRVMAQSRLMAAAPSLDTPCGGTATLVVEAPQVRQFSYRGLLAAPTDVIPTEYHKSAEEAAAGVVGYVREDRQEPDAPFIDDPHFRFVGVGAVQAPDELGHRIFWITLHLADCLAES
ncbi:MAG: hypothetical protein OXI84_01085 [bacterium]|nr:hypothetical protein [bacterium]